VSGGCKYRLLPPLGELTALPQIPFTDHVAAEKEWGKRRKGEGKKRKDFVGKGTEGMKETLPEINVWFRP